MTTLWWPSLEPVVESLAWTLVHFLWQGSLAAMLLGATLFFLRGTDARWRYGAGCTALTLMALAPLVTFATLHADGGSPASLSAATRSTEVVFAQWSPVAATGPALEDQVGIFQQLVPWLVGSWMLGVLALGLLHFRSWRGLQRTRAAGVRPAQPFWQERADHLSSLLGLARRTVVLLSDHVQVPSVVGWLRPVVLLPTSCLTGLTTAEVEMILLHELAHVRRRDYLVNLLQVAVETLLFYHPAVWWVSRQIRLEREVCCDDAAIAVQGDAHAYAVALTRVEALRSVTPSMAMGSDGGSLLHRIRRLAGHPTEALPATRRPALAASLLVLSAFTALALLTVDQRHTANAALLETEETAVAEAAVQEDDAPETTSSRHGAEMSGRWSAEMDGDKLYLSLRTRDHDGGRSNFGLRLDPDEFDGFRLEEDAEFTLRRDAGIFTFTGDFDAQHRDGDGRFTFAPRAGFEDQMRKRGIGNLDEEDVYIMGALDVGLDFVDGLKQLGVRDLDREEIVAMGIHGATPAYVSEMIDRGVESRDPDDFVAMRIHGVSADYVDAIREAGYDVEVEDLVAWKIHGVSTEFIEEMGRMGFDELPADELVQMRIHGVSPEFVRSMRDAGYDVDIETLVQCRIHGVSPEFIDEMAELGLADVDMEDLVQMRIHGVSPAFLEELRRAGYENIDVEQAVQWRIHGVSPEFIREMAELGYAGLSADQLVQMRIHGVSPGWVKKLQSKGLTDIDVDDLIKMKIHGIEL